jgi:hypothetical protein
VYIGVALLFVIGSLFGYSFNQTSGVSGYSLSRSSGGVVHGDGLPTVLVTGGLGFIGSHVVEDLLANDFHVRVVRAQRLAVYH